MRIVRLVGEARNNSAENNCGTRHPVATPSGTEWLGIEAIAGIGVTSEDADAPVENVLDPSHEGGWRAGEPGPQTIQLTFSGPTNIRRIQLVFREATV